MAGPIRLALVAALSMLFVGCGSTGTGLSPAAAPSAAASVSPPPITGSATQRSEVGEVTVEATWGGPASGATFELKLDTHTVDLDALDLSDAILRNDRDEALTARPWTAAMGGHHRAGVLTFDGDAAGLFADAKWIELVVAGVGDLPERVLRWEITP
jgi:hypothetical protein